MYRTGNHDGALKRLEAVSSLRSELLPSEFAVKAMAFVALGRHTEAESAVVRLDGQPDAMRAADEDSVRLIKELHLLLAERKDR